VEIDGSKVETAYALIKEMVTNYRFVPEHKLRIAPGEHLQIDDLSDRARVSATPVRQALARLHGEALIESVPNRGFFSKIPNTEELQDLYELALLILERSIRKDLNEFSALADRLLGAAEAKQGALWNSQVTSSIQFQACAIESMFEGIARLSRNDEILRTVRNFNARSRYIRCLYLEEYSAEDPPVNDVRTLGELSRGGDADRTCIYLRQMMTRRTIRLPDLVRRGRVGAKTFHLR
jgi:DNA-binding GntR family transcriptional regulator